LTELNKKAMKMASVDKKKMTPTSLYQCVVFYKELVPKRNFLDKPFYVEKMYPSPEVFLNERDVQLFVPYFVKRLIEQELIGQEVVLPDKSIDQELVIISSSKLMVTQMEKVDPLEGDHD
jgi:hypothetical protein